MSKRSRSAGKHASGKRAAKRPSQQPAILDLYRFGRDVTDGDATMRELLGGKGANLAQMSRLGLPVPPGFTIPTSSCTTYFTEEQKLPKGLKSAAQAALVAIGNEMGAGFGDADNPLLVSARSGAKVSMPGMMDTILNLGLNDETVEGLAKRSGDPRCAYDSYRRFIQMYGDIVLGIDHGEFEDLLENYKIQHDYTMDSELQASDWRQIVTLFKGAVETERGTTFPQDVYQQLWGAIGAVFQSWQTPRAQTYRRLHHIPDDWGTAVTVQAMVFGNMGEQSATGVAFTRNPSTGAREVFGEFLLNAQGEDVVAGIRTPCGLTKAAQLAAGDDKPSLEALMPELFGQLQHAFSKLEADFKDMQDVEFTIQAGKLWLLQTRTGKRTTAAALKIAADMVNEGMIAKPEAVMRIKPDQLDQLLHPTIDTTVPRKIIARGLPASPGAATGEIVFHPEQAQAAKRDGRDVILVRSETSAKDIHGMYSAAGILTARGGMTSHAAVVARGMGRPCISGAGMLRIDAKANVMTVLGKTYALGEVITIDGRTGQVLAGDVAMRQPDLSGDFATIMEWADELRRMSVCANADTPRDASQALHFGAQGIGLCRTEHMFFDDQRLLAMREMICATSREARQAALDKIEPMQRADFAALFAIMTGRPVTIRLFDPPLHEFLPTEEKDIAALATALALPQKQLHERLAELAEINPMLGFRGCRLGIKYPEITKMQARAIFAAAAEVSAKTGDNIIPEIMIPLIAFAEEFTYLADVIRAAAKEVEQASGDKPQYRIGAMIELPRACLEAAEIARNADFLSFGTNDLTQTCLGLSRDDAAPILAAYEGHKIFDIDPFVSIESKGVGALIKLAVARAKSVRPNISLGMCGEHAGDAASVAFAHEVGLSYVSASPYRVPIARLAAAQAAIQTAIQAQRSRTR